MDSNGHSAGLESLFSDRIIAIVWDFDKTLTPEYMQTPLFDEFDVDQARFWREVQGLPPIHTEAGAERVSEDTLYLNHILTYVRADIFHGLNNAKLKELGSSITFFPGVISFLDGLRECVRADSEFSRHRIRLEHYVVSTGLRQMIMGSKVADHLDGVWACEFSEMDVSPPGSNGQASLPDNTGVINQVVYAIDNTSKTRAIFEINKGANKVAGIDVNASIRERDRRIPFRNMIYIADGPSDIPSFSIVKGKGGRTFAVYEAGDPEAFSQANTLHLQGRVDAIGPADYRSGTHTAMWIQEAVRGIAERIVKEFNDALRDRVGPPPGHATQ